MKRTLIALAVLVLLSGCAGLQTAWRLQLDMRYVTPEDEKAAPAPAAIAPGKPA